MIFPKLDKTGDRDSWLVQVVCRRSAEKEPRSSLWHAGSAAEPPFAAERGEQQAGEQRVVPDVADGVAADDMFRLGQGVEPLVGFGQGEISSAAGLGEMPETGGVGRFAPALAQRCGHRKTDAAT